MNQPVNIEGLSADAAAAVIKLSRGMANSKDIGERVAFYDLAAKTDPTIALPPDVQIEKFKRDQKARDDAREIETRQKETNKKLEAQRKSLIESGRYDEDTVSKMEKEIMEPRGISDYDIAATLYAAANPEPDVHVPVRGQAGATWDMPWKTQSKDQVSALLANPRKAALEKAHAVVTELRKKRA